RATPGSAPSTLGLDVGTFGAIGDGVSDVTAAFDAAIASASQHAVTIYFRSGTYRFMSRPRPIPVGVRLVGSGSVGSTPGYGTYLVADYADSGPQRAFLEWDGSDNRGAAGTGGGIEGLVVYRAAGRSGGTAIRLSGTDDNHRAGFFTLTNVIV